VDEETSVVRAASAPLYDSLAADYDAHFLVPHRAAYDELAWELAAQHLPESPGVIVDAGCGSGRWAARFAADGHHVVGIECAPEMVAAARRRLGTAIDMIAEPMETAQPALGTADLVVAIGSLQYADEPQAVLARLASWVRPGGWVVVVVDSLVSLVRELFALGRDEEAFARLRTRCGHWVQDGISARMHLLDAATLRHAFEQAQLAEIEVKGLLVGWSALGPTELLRRLDVDYPGQLEVERRLSDEPLLRDLGKQLYACGRVPGPTGAPGQIRTAAFASGGRRSIP
jgi:SAM-dependent methyltransferase